LRQRIRLTRTLNRGILWAAGAPARTGDSGVGVCSLGMSKTRKDSHKDLKDLRDADEVKEAFS
jgi:hypothetical protein